MNIHKDSNIEYEIVDIDNLKNHTHIECQSNIEKYNTLIEAISGSKSQSQVESESEPEPEPETGAKSDAKVAHPKRSEPIIDSESESSESEVYGTKDDEDEEQEEEMMEEEVEEESAVAKAEATVPATVTEKGEGEGELEVEEVKTPTISGNKRRRQELTIQESLIINEPQATTSSGGTTTFTAANIMQRRKIRKIVEEVDKNVPIRSAAARKQFQGTSTPIQQSPPPPPRSATPPTTSPPPPPPTPQTSASQASAAAKKKIESHPFLLRNLKLKNDATSNDEVTYDNFENLHNKLCVFAKSIDSNNMNYHCVGEIVIQKKSLKINFLVAVQHLLNSI